MRISVKAEELAKLKYIQHAQVISGRHYANIQRHETTMQRGGAMKRAIDREHVDMAREIAETYANCYLESFLAEGLLPDTNDLREIRTGIENIIGRHKGNEFWIPRPSTSEALLWLPQHVFGRFVARVKQMELEGSLQRPAEQVGSHHINIHGDNYAPIQQGGQGNIQNIDMETEDEVE